MSENQTESNQTGEQDLPNPTFSETGVSSTSQGADEIVSKLTPVIQQIVERTVQSTKDKRISKIEKALGGRLDSLAELEELGVSIPKEVRTEMQIRELREQITQQPAQPAAVRDDGSSQPKTAVDEAMTELREAGLSVDADVIEIFRGKYANRAAFDLAVQKHINKKLRPPKPANPADVVQSPIRTGATEKSKEALTSDYLNELAGARGKGYQVGDAIKAKYRQMGLNVDEIAIRV